LPSGRGRTLANTSASPEQHLQKQQVTEICLKEVKKEISMLYNSALNAARNNNVGITLNPLTDDQANAIQVHLKTKYKPFATYWEYLCPSNNTTFIVVKIS
jgi:hypothetical protein